MKLSRRGQLNNMTSELIEKHLGKLKDQNKFDDGFVDILVEANKNGEDGEVTAERILSLIKQRYAESKTDKS